MSHHHPSSGKSHPHPHLPRLSDCDSPQFPPQAVGHTGPRRPDVLVRPHRPLLAQCTPRVPLFLVSAILSCAGRLAAAAHRATVSAVGTVTTPDLLCLGLWVRFSPWQDLILFQFRIPFNSIQIFSELPKIV
jgi:hypothetical protein